ncbi:WG repeat-containing protein [Marivirga sp. S37H4]|uniref:WG repeat-containing protein n=1 Tax=Marivirga aurantiaca TaxID=2802615 RepID=A0A934X1L7_9BACT|nr:WG repeat-containing protein [Marivirga aurantiaca]
MSDSLHKIFSVNQKKGIKDSNGKVVLPAIYDELGWSDNLSRPHINYLGYKKDKLWGLFDAELNPVSPPQYVALYPLNEDLYIASIKGKYSRTNFYGLIDKEGKVKTRFSYRNLLPAGEFIIAASKQNNTIQFGLLNSDGKKLLPFDYFQIRHLGSNKFELTENSGEKSLIFLNKKPEVIHQNLDSISDFQDGVAILFRNGKQGLIAEDGRLLLPLKYKEIEWNNGKNIYATTLDQWQILDQETNLVQEIAADTVFFLNDSLLIKNTAGFSEVYHFHDEEVLSSLKGKFLGVFGDCFILKKGGLINLVSEDSSKRNVGFSGEVYWNEDYFIGERKKFSGNKYELINKAGATIVADTFHFMPNSITVRKNGFWGLYNLNFQEVIPGLYDEIQPVGNSHYMVKFRKRMGVIDESNNWIISPEYIQLKKIGIGIYHGVDKFLVEFIISGSHKAEARLHYDIYGDIIVETDVQEKFRLVDERGIAITDFSTGSYAGHNDKGILFRNGDKLSFYNSSGQKTFQITGYDTVFLSTDEYIPIIKNNSYGFINYQGLLRIANRYDSVRNFQEELAAVKIRNNWGFIDRSEKLQIQPYFSEVSDFRNGFAVVKLNDKYGIINAEGKYEIDADYDQIIELNGFYLLNKNKQWGVADENGRVLNYPSYESIEVLGDYFKVKKYGKYRILDKNVHTVIDNQYDKVIYDEERHLFLCMKRGEKHQVFLTDLLKGKNP